ncbi:hypothetical protein PGH12_13580 [Chryseobacterium wangxinyae]|uniref:hypothetical protein n=1 Tax=Chryseobacterium sp. CY350 TaxID=2997336 RepID=UPI00226EAE26|nr:hypothetical protein [Chryseobacterium sp. CY350]MCY0975897.1 hypothetical protein [Chryseobacterium sp. CY350]WBZ94497.1 hypothetical protein PGH12_13580 [Chryseobacterium sp. CY350]
MNQRFTFLKVFFLMLVFFCTAIKAQLTCTPTNYNDITIMNTAGGTNASNGLRILLSGAGNLQVYRLGSPQIFNSDMSFSFSPNTVPGTTNGIVWMIGTTKFNTGTLNASFGGTSLTPVSSACTNSGSTFQHVINFSQTVSGLVYGLKVTYDYVSPNNYLTISYEVTIPTGGQQVKVAQGWDTLLGSSDRGPGFVSGIAPNYIMGTQQTVSGSVIYEAFKYKSGQPWSGYYSALYSSLNSDLGADNVFNNTINTSSTTDNGIGISVDYGSTAGTFSSVNDVIFLCNAPTSAPTYSSTNYTLACGAASVNIAANYNGVAIGSLPAGVTIRYLDSLGNIVSTPTAVTTAGTYYAMYVDSNNADCTSPSTTITVAQGACCTAIPTVNTALSNTCPATSVNLNNAYTGSTSLPTGTALEWHTAATSPSAGNLVATPTAVTTAGTYYAYYRDTTNNCYSSASSGVVVTIANCCNAGNTAPVIN